MSLMHRIINSLLLLLIFVPTQNALAAKWPKPTATFLTGNLPSGGPDSGLPGDTQTWQDTAREAAINWNAAQGIFTLVTSTAVGNVINCEVSGDNSLSFSYTECDKSSFGDSLLAVTRSWSPSNAPNTIIESDIIFNSNKIWGIYDGNLVFSLQDFRRVATHEFGHAMGLDHTTNASALMFPTASDTFLPTSDDVESLESIYKEEKGSGGVSYLLLLTLGIWRLRLLSTHKKAD